MCRICSLFLHLVLCTNCIGEDFIDDYVDPSLRITNPISSIQEGFSYQFEASFFDESGTKVVNPTLKWTATPPTTLKITQKGIITALSAGEVTVQVSTQGLQGNSISTQIDFTVIPSPMEELTGSTTETTNTISPTVDNSNPTSGTGTSTSTTTSSTTTSSTTASETTMGNGVIVIPQVYQGEIRSTSSYLLQGGFRYEHNGEHLVLQLDSNYKADTALPGLYVYLTNNPTTPQGGYEIGSVSVFEGAHQYNLPASIGIMDYKYILYWCKPFSVKVGDAVIFD